MKKVLLLTALLVLTFVVSLAAQPLANEPQAADLDTISVLRGSLFMTTNAQNPPDWQNGVYRISPATQDSLWLTLMYDDTMHVGKELAEIVLYSAGFSSKPTPKTELYLFSIAKPIPDSVKTSWQKFQRWGYRASKIPLGQLEYELNGPFGRIAPYGKKIRPGFFLAGKTYAFLVKRPAWNPNSLVEVDNRLSAFAGLALVARKAGESSVDLTVGLPSQPSDGNSWGNSNWNWFTMSLVGLVVLLVLGAIGVFVYHNLLGKRA